MAELNFNALARPGPRGFMQGYEQGQEQRMAQETNQIAQDTSRFKLEELKRDREEAMQLQTQLKSLGHDGDLNAFFDEIAKTGKPQYVQMALEGKQKLKDLDAYAKLGGGGAMPTGAPAPAVSSNRVNEPNAAFGVEVFKVPEQLAPVNALAAPTPAAMPVNALAPQSNADQIAPTQQRIRQLLDFARVNPRMASQAMSEARILQDQLELFSKRGQNEPPDAVMMQRLGYPPTQEGFKAYQDAKRQDRLLTPAELQQKLQIAAASRPPGTTVTMVSERAEQGARGKMLVDQYGDISKAAGLAARTLPAIESNLSALNKGFDTGFGKETVAAGASVLAALGVKDAEKFATDTQKFQSNAIGAVLQKQLEQKGPQTESDAKRIEQIGAQLGKTKDANTFILATAKEQLKRDVDQRNFYDRWYKANKTYDGAEDAWFNGEGGQSLFDRPALKKYNVSAADVNVAPTASNRPSLESIFKK
jgi:hypothetical protein